MASFFSTKAKKWIEGRKNLNTRIASFPFEKDSWVWFHCASFGEFQEARNLIEAFKTQYPPYKLLLTFFSPSGYEVNKDYKGADLVLYMPPDTKANAEFFLDKVKPKAVFLVRSDVWPNYISGANRRNIPVF
jgi:3-deoxy-D-manno-octulosonic-acid transferase